MKKYNIYILLISLIAIGFSSCELEETPAYEKLTSNRENTQVYIPKSSMGIHYLNTFSLEDLEVLEENSINFNIGLGAVGLPADDIKIELVENTKVIDSLNVYREINGEDLYIPFPSEAYQIDNLSLTIPSGKEYSNLATLTFNPALFDMDRNYLLAFSINQAMDYPINPDNSTIIFAVRDVVIPEPEPVYIDKDNWQVINFSSEEISGEGSNGSASLVIDGQESTYWHSCWTCSESFVYPHELVIDLGGSVEIDGFELTQRDGDRKINDYELLVSQDNQGWSSLGEFQLQAHAIAQEVLLEETQSIRYVKIIMKSSQDGAGFAALAEISAFSLP